MKRVQLSACLLEDEETIEEALCTALKIRVTETLLEQLMKRMYDEAKDTIIVIESLDMRLHLSSALCLVVFCYEYGFQLDLFGEGRELLHESLVSAFEIKNGVSKEIAINTIHELINGEGQTLIKRRDTKPFSIEEIQETK